MVKFHRKIGVTTSNVGRATMAKNCVEFSCWRILQELIRMCNKRQQKGPFCSHKELNSAKTEQSPEADYSQTYLKKMWYSHRLEWILKDFAKTYLRHRLKKNLILDLKSIYH